MCGEVEHAAAERAAVVDAHHDGAAGREVGHAEHGVERQPRAGRRQLVGIEDLAVGGAVTGEARPVPARLPGEPAAAAAGAGGRDRAAVDACEAVAAGLLGCDLALDLGVEPRQHGLAGGDGPVEAAPGRPQAGDLLGDRVVAGAERPPLPGQDLLRAVDLAQQIGRRGVEAVDLVDPLDEIGERSRGQDVGGVVGGAALVVADDQRRERRLVGPQRLGCCDAIAPLMPWIDSSKLRRRACALRSTVARCDRRQFSTSIRCRTAAASERWLETDAAATPVGAIPAAAAVIATIMVQAMRLRVFAVCRPP